MATSQGGSEATVRAAAKPAASVGEILRLLSAGATGAILLALGEGPMQTKVLTHRVRGYTARTVYRYLPKLAQLGVVERDDEPGGRARVVHTLSEGKGDELCDLIHRFAEASMTRLPDGQVGPETWASLGLLADLWDAGVVEELSRGPRSQTELARGLDALSYHQLSRRISQFETSGFFAAAGKGRRQARRYSLTPKARRTMALIAGIGRWRHRHLATVGDGGLTAEEMATVLRATFPLTRWGEVGQEVLVEVAADRSVQCWDAANWAAGEVEDWMAVLLDGDVRVEAGGHPRAVEDCLVALHETLWAPSPF
jgi:DNA-binding HxlR family transcriptional regulator